MGSKIQQVVRVLRFDAEHWAENVKVEKVPIPEIGNGQALVNIILRPANPSDVLAVQGVYGDKVTLSSCTVPDGVTNEQAASFWINPVTAVGLIRSHNIPEGKWLVQGAAGSALGRQIIKVAQDYGFKTVNVIRRSSKKQQLLDLGADVVISTDEVQDLTQAIKDVVGEEGAWGAIDPVAGDMTGKLLSAVRNGGKVLVYAALSGLEVNLNVLDVLVGQKSVHGFWVGPYMASRDKLAQDEIIEEVFRLLSRNIIDTYKGPTFSLQDAVKALQAAENPEGGKVYIANA